MHVRMKGTLTLMKGTLARYVLHLLWEILDAARAVDPIVRQKL